MSLSFAYYSILGGYSAHVFVLVCLFWCVCSGVFVLVCLFWCVCSGVFVLARIERIPIALFCNPSNNSKKTG
jgi:hypothetical protein